MESRHGRPGRPPSTGRPNLESDTRVLGRLECHDERNGLESELRKTGPDSRGASDRPVDAASETSRYRSKSEPSSIVIADRQEILNERVELVDDSSVFLAVVPVVFLAGGIVLIIVRGGVLERR